VWGAQIKPLDTISDCLLKQPVTETRKGKATVNFFLKNI